MIQIPISVSKDIGGVLKTENFHIDNVDLDVAMAITCHCGMLVHHSNFVLVEEYEDE